VTLNRKSTRLPAKLRVLLKRDLKSHLNAQMGARHFTHIRKAHSTSAKARSKEKANQVPKVEVNLPLYYSDCGLLARKGLHDVKILGQILLLCPRPGLIVQVELHQKNRRPVVMRVSTGPSVVRLRKAVDRFNAIGGGEAEFELRALGIPSFHLFALWAHRPKHVGDDWLMATDSNFAGLLRGRRYKRSKAEALLRKCAIAMILRWYERAQQENLKDYRPGTNT
jgi:hypothetical protein